MPIPLPLLAAGMALTNPETAGRVGGWIASVTDPSHKLYRQQLKEERRRINANDFGLSESEKNAQQAAMMRMQQAAAKNLEADLTRQAAATGFGRSGLQAKAQRDLGAEMASQAGKFRGDIEKASSELGLAQKEQALARLKARRDEVKGQAKEAGETAATATKDFAAGLMKLKAGQAGNVQTGDDPLYKLKAIAGQSGGSEG